MKTGLKKTNKQSLLSNSGQILVEYILLLVIAVSCATLLVKAFVSRQEGSEGMVIKNWDRILKTIGNDLPDCPNQSDFNSPNCPP